MRMLLTIARRYLCKNLVGFCQSSDAILRQRSGRRRLNSDAKRDTCDLVNRVVVAPEYVYIAM
jgi:hypothetical protein